MQSARIASVSPLRHVWWGLLLMLGFVIGFLLMGPNIPLLAASNGAPMADAARADDLPAVRKLIKERGDVNTPANDGSSALLWAASLQLAAATPNCVTFEFCQAYYPLLYDLLTTPVAVDADGYVSVPARPGLGVELQPEDELMRKYPFEGGTR